MNNGILSREMASAAVSRDMFRHKMKTKESCVEHQAVHQKWVSSRPIQHVAKPSVVWCLETPH